MGLRTLFDCQALITGASAGIGREIARQLCPEAGLIILVARRRDRLEELKSELELVNPALRVEHYVADIADEGELDGLLQWLDERGHAINFLVNNAGLGDHGPFEESDWGRNRAMIEVNIRALTRLTHALLPGMKARGEGSILNVSSVASYLPLPDMAVYAATKAYVTSFSEAIRAELRGSGVSVTALCPGPVDTEFGDVAERDGTRPSGLTSPEVFKVSVSQVASEALDAVVSDRARVVPGLLVCLAMTAISLTPIFLLRHILSKR